MILVIFLVAVSLIYLKTCLVEVQVAVDVIVLLNQVKETACGMI